MHSISIAVLYELMKCATRTQILLSSTPCSHKSQMITLVIVHNFIFQLNLISLMNCEAFTTMKMAARATAARARVSEHQSNHRRTKPATDSEVSVVLK